MIDLAEIWLVFTILSPGEGARVLDLDLAPKVKQACTETRRQDAAGLELEWGETPGAALLATQASSTDGKQFYVAWLKDRYNYNIAKLNQAYGLEAISFTDLTESDFKQVDRQRPAVVEDDRLFLIDLAATLKQRIDEMFQACAPGRKTAWKRKRT